MKLFTSRAEADFLGKPREYIIQVPSVFVTNAGNSLRQEKADKLTEWLGVPISEDQVSSSALMVSCSLV